MPRTCLRRSALVTALSTLMVMGGGGLTSAAAANNPIPRVDQSLYPASTPPGAATLIVTVSGTGFATGAVVRWNGAPRVTEFISSSQLRVVLLTADLATLSTGRVTVFNPPPGGGVSNPVAFPVAYSSLGVGLLSSSFTGGDFPVGIATGYFNADMHADVVTADYAGNTVSVFLGNGAGQFHTHMDFATATAPFSIAVTDLNGDGIQDLIVGCGSQSAPNVISVLLGNGDGTFRSHVDYPAIAFPTGISVGDFNEDGKMDVVASNFSNRGQGLSLFLGNGDGTLQPPLSIASGSHLSKPAVGDFNGDGHLDLVAAVTNTPVGAAGKVAMLLGNGDGTFRPEVDYNTSSGSISVETADFDRDGKLDLAVVTSFNEGGVVSILRGNGDGTFQKHMDYSINSVAPISVAVGDFNGDGTLDLMVDDSMSSATCFMAGRGDGTFRPASLMRLNFGVSPIVAADFNGDGRLDVAGPSGNFGVDAFTVGIQDPLPLSANLISIATKVVGTVSPLQTVMVSNVSSQKHVIQKVSLTNDFDFQFTSSCAALDPGASCAIHLNFTPQNVNQLTSTLTVKDDGPGSPETATLAGYGTYLEVSPGKLDFGAQKVGTTSAPKTVTLTNTSNASVTAKAFGDSSFSIVNNCPENLDAGASCTLSVTFSPTSTGQHALLAFIFTSAGGFPVFTLRGTGI